MNNLFRLLLLCLFVLAPQFAQAQQLLQLGVFAYRDADKVQQEFGPLAEYLSSKLQDTEVRLQVLDEPALLTKIAAHQLDLLLINPSLYEIIRHENTLNLAIATVKRQYQGNTTASLGGVILTRNDDSVKINHFKDLQGKTVSIPGKTHIGGYRAPIYELVSRKIDPSSLNFIETGNNDRALQALLNKQSDVAFIRNGILECWIKQGRLTSAQVRVFTPYQLKGYPFAVSTQLYPEWPFVALSHVSEKQVQAITVALLQLEADAPAAQAAGIAGFKPTSNYLPIQTLLHALKVSPYDQEPEVSFKQIWQQYQSQILLGSFLLTLLVFFYIRSAKYNFQLQNQSRQIEEQHKRLVDIVKATRAGTWEWNLQTGTTKFNERWAEMLGYQLEELEPNIVTWKRLTHPEDLIKSNQALQAHFSGAKDYYDCEIRMRHKNGHWVWILDRGRVVEWQEDGSPLKVSGTHQDISEQKENELLRELQYKRDEALLKLPGSAETLSESDFMQYGMELIEALTDSQISFIHFIHPDQKTIELVTWSKQTLAHYCHASNLETHYPLEEAGIWADAFRQRQPIIINDYATAPNKKGLPEGHSHLENFISIPVFEQGEIVMITGVGNKPGDYHPQDVETTQLISNEIWRLVQRKRSLALIAQQKAEYQRLVDDISSNFVIYSHNAKGNLLYVSDSVYQVFGISKEQILSGLWQQEVDWLKEDLKLAEQRVEKLITQKIDSAEYTLRFIHPNGKQKTLKVTEHANFDADGNFISIDGLLEDITEELAAQQALKRAASVFEEAIEGILILDCHLRIISANNAFSQITGYEEAEILGRYPRILKYNQQNRLEYRNMWSSLKSKGYWKGEMWHLRKNSEAFYSRMSVSVIYDDFGQVEQYIVLFSDITEQKIHQQKLEKLAHFDALTGLPNRILLADRLNHAMSLVQRRGSALAIAFLDLDGFKEVNDDFGHEAGDELLKQVAQRLINRLREVDTVARLGGDEFILVIDEVTTQANLEKVLNRILTDVSTPVLYQEQSLEVSVSIGITFYPQAETIDAEQLIRQADQAMYQAKMQGKNRYTFFNGLMPRTAGGQQDASP